MSERRFTLDEFMGVLKETPDEFVDLEQLNSGQTMQSIVKNRLEALPAPKEVSRKGWSDMEMCSIREYANAGSSREPVFSKERKAVGKHYPVTITVRDGHDT